MVVDPEILMHLFVNCKLVDSVWTEIFQKMNEFHEQNEIKSISKSEMIVFKENNSGCNLDY